MAVEEILSSASTAIEGGITLVEASAGTGKTFAISMHVLRAVADLQISIDQILVVTFTVAATEELKDRIRVQLLEGRNILSEAEGQYSEVLKQWAARVEDKKLAVRRLDLALLDIDRIGIYTIHGFCQRMLTEQPLESGQLFDLELISDAQLIKTAVVNDYWRATFYDLDRRYCALATEYFPDPGSLYQSVVGSDDLLAELIPEKGSVDRCCSLIELRFAEFRRWWQENASALLGKLDQAAREGYLNKDLCNNYQNRYEEIEQCISVSQPPGPEVIRWLEYDQLIAQLNGRKLRGLEKKQDFISGWGLPGEVVPFYIDAVEKLILEIRLDLADQLRTAFPRRLEHQQKMTFDDLVIRLASSVSGPEGAQLRHKIRQRYRMVLIDEFQDTDSAQWHIFSALFSAPPHILYLIGDPKQAIYRFRGADIHSYFQAREQARRIVTLNRNFRSHPGLMEAVNDLLAGTSIAGLAYKRVEPARKDEDFRLVDKDGERAALVCCQLDQRAGSQPRWSGGSAHDRIRKWIVDEIARLIAPQNDVMIEISRQQGRTSSAPLEPADIAILVRTNSQAQEYHDALAEVSIPSVVASKNSVFKTAECEQLLLVLRAAAVPGEIGGLKAALSCDWFGLTGEYFVLLNSDESLLGKWVERYQSYHQLWQDEGFLVMITRLLVDENVFVQLSRLAQGERRIANIQHLCELAQEMIQLQGLTMEQTVIWLQKMISSTVGVDEMELRLESDGEAVAIVTMHGAKGLEFPITFCPYLMTPSRSAQRDRSITRCYDKSNRLILDLGSENLDENRKRAQAEEEQEDLRLAYVAITRAQLRCYLFWADIKGWGGNPGSFQSPIGKMLFAEGRCGFEGQHRRFQLLGSRASVTHLLIDEAADEIRDYAAPIPENVQLQTRERGERTFTTRRTLTSFSGLVSFSAVDDEVLTGASDEKGMDSRVLESSRLPGGVRFGNVVHSVLEKTDFAELAGECYDHERIARICHRHGLEVDQDGLKQLLKDTVTTRLFDSGNSATPFALADIEPEQQVKELEFSLFMAPTTTSSLNRILGSQQTYLPLLYREMEGFINGYIDLICAHEGRYYVLDYKTNHLGDSTADYSRDALIAAMRAHNYGLQYWLYTVVVHRYLKKWLPRYSYKDHFGGVMYLFVRGMDPQKDGSGVFSTCPDEQVVQELDHCFGDNS